MYYKKREVVTQPQNSTGGKSSNPTAATFNTKLAKRWEKGLFLCVGLDTSLDRLPDHFAGMSAEDALFDFNRQIIEATADYAAAFKLNLAFYEQSGTDGVLALKRTCDWLRGFYHDIPIILDAKRGDLDSTNKAYANALFNYYGGDAVTVHPYLGSGSLAPFLDRPEKGVFVLCRTSNQDSGEIQNLQVGQDSSPLYLHIARIASGEDWNRNGNIGLVAGATHPVELGKIRKTAPTAPLLIPGVGAQGGELSQVLAHGLDANGYGVLINASRSLIYASSSTDFARVARQEAIRLTEQMQQIRQHVLENRKRGQQSDELDAGVAKLADMLFEIGAVKFGAFRIKLHETQPDAPLSPIYLNFRILRSSPSVLTYTAQMLLRLAGRLKYDLLADIPTGVTPIVSVMCHLSGRPMISPRKDVKAYGLGVAVDGEYQAGQTVLLVDDVISGGESKFEAIEKLEQSELQVKDVLVVVDREQGGRQTLVDKGYRPHAVATISQLLQRYRSTGVIDEARYQEVLNYLGLAKA